MFGAPDKGKIKAAFEGFSQRLSEIEKSAAPKNIEVRLSNLEKMVKDLSQAFE